MTMDEIKQEVAQRLLQLSGLGYRVRFDIDDAGALGIDGTVEPPAFYEPDSEEQDCTIRLSRDNFLALLSGDLNPTFAYTLGKLKVEGSLGVAMKLAAMLDE